MLDTHLLKTLWTRHSPCCTSGLQELVCEPCVFPCPHRYPPTSHIPLSWLRCTLGASPAPLSPSSTHGPSGQTGASMATSARAGFVHGDKDDGAILTINTARSHPAPSPWQGESSSATYRNSGPSLPELASCDVGTSHGRLASPGFTLESISLAHGVWDGHCVVLDPTRASLLSCIFAALCALLECRTQSTARRAGTRRS